MSIKCILWISYLSWSFPFWQKSSLLLSFYSGSGIVFLCVLSVFYSAVSITINLLFYFQKLEASIIRWYMVSATVRTFQYIDWAMAHFMIATAPTTSLSFICTSGCYVTRTSDTCSIGLYVSSSCMVRSCISVYLPALQSLAMEYLLLLLQF